MIDKEKLERLFNKTKEAALIHKEHLDELTTIIEESEKYGYNILVTEISDVENTLIKAQGDINFSDFLIELDKHKYYPPLTDKEYLEYKEKGKF